MKKVRCSSLSVLNLRSFRQSVSNRHSVSLKVQLMAGNKILSDEIKLRLNPPRS